MPIKFLVRDNDINVVEFNDATTLDKLPAQVYTLKFDMMRGYYLGRTQTLLDSPNKIYGRVKDRVEKCLHTYKTRTDSTGILLTGYKGTGKTLLMTTLANKAITELNIPVILIRNAYSGAGFEEILKQIGECCLLFDEFGKMYKSSGDEDNEAQESLLSLLDGVDKTKRLFIFTENFEYSVNDFLFDRPSRIFYHFKYSKLDEESIKDYCKDKKVNKKLLEELLFIVRRSRVFSFDMLQSIVEECLRYSLTVPEALPELNIDLAQSAAFIKVVEIKYTDSPEMLIKPSKEILEKPSGSNYSARVAYIRGEIIGQNIKEKDRDISLTIEDNEIVYQDDKKTVYETGRFTVTTIDVPPPPVRAY